MIIKPKFDYIYNASVLIVTVGWLISTGDLTSIIFLLH